MLIVSAESAACDRYELRAADTDDPFVARTRAVRVAKLLAQIGDRDTWAGGRVTVHQRDGDRLLLVARVAVVHAAPVPAVADPCGEAAEPEPEPVEVAPMFETHTEIKAVEHNGQKLWKWSVELRPDNATGADLEHQRSGIEKSMNDAQLAMATAVRQMETNARALGFKFPEG